MRRSSPRCSPPPCGSVPATCLPWCGCCAPTRPKASLWCSPSWRWCWASSRSSWPVAPPMHTPRAFCRPCGAPATWLSWASTPRPSSTCACGAPRGTKRWGPRWSPPGPCLWRGMARRRSGRSWRRCSRGWRRWCYAACGPSTRRTSRGSSSARRPSSARSGWWPRCRRWRATRTRPARCCRPRAVWCWPTRGWRWPRNRPPPPTRRRTASTSTPRPPGPGATMPRTSSSRLRPRRRRTCTPSTGRPRTWRGRWPRWARGSLSCCRRWLVGCRRTSSRSFRS
mmetsp:Transcript_32897/g.106373  ORF Transcript_32897/g.106373 Transcript_32897/m.106373 type:complete len:282 (+) Transcript_32897:1324-2169(+)